MKKLLFILLCLPFIGFAQSVPQGINYQAVARDASGDVLMNQPLTIQFSIITDITSSAISWQETHQVTTNDYGLFTAIIGKGTPSGGNSATFDVIDWGSSNHSLKVEINYGNGYIDMGTTDFMSVPYSLHAKTAANGSTTDELQTLSISGDTLFISSGNYIILPSSTPSLQIGDFHQGGIIFWLDGNGGGLIAATKDQTFPSYGAEWGCSGNLISGADGVAIGTGNQNTIDIEAGCTTPETAADKCANLTLNGYSDWFLPSKDELHKMYLNIGQGNTLGLGNIGIFASNPYWSSTEFDANHAWQQDFDSGGQYSFFKYNPSYANAYVRAVRTF